MYLTNVYIYLRKNFICLYKMDKLKLMSIVSLEFPEDNNEFSLITNYKEIISLSKLYDSSFTKIIFSSKNNVHKLLYELEENIHIEIDKEEKYKNLDNLFYLNLLILANTNIINYTYSFDLILELNNFNNKNKSILKKILYSMIIIELIDNYKQFYIESNTLANIHIDRDIKSIELFNRNIIKNNLYNLKDYKINLILNNENSHKKDEIYIQILKQLIINNDFEDYDFIYNIINELDLGNINLNKYMIYELKKILNNDEYNEIKEKKIIYSEDFSIQKKINFYFILLKYILIFYHFSLL